MCTPANTTVSFIKWVLSGCSLHGIVNVFFSQTTCAATFRNALYNTLDINCGLVDYKSIAKYLMGFKRGAHCMELLSYFFLRLNGAATFRNALYNT